MSITSTLALSIGTGDGAAQMTKSVAGLSFAGINEMYIQPQLIGVDPPAQPTATAGTGGSMSAGSYLVKITYVNAPQGESLPSPESAAATVSASGKLTIKSPVASLPAQSYNVYITAAGGGTGTETKQNTTPIAIGTDYVQSAAVSGGASLPGSNSTLVFAATLPQLPVQLAYLRNMAQAVLNTPAAPALTQVLSGSLAATTYYVRVTLVTALGETLASPETSLAVLINNVLQVSPPLTAVAIGWNVYVSSSSGTETKQNITPIALGSSWTEPNSGLISGSALPTANTTGRTATVAWTPLDGASNNVLDLTPQAAIAFCENAVGGGITAITVTASASQTPIEAFFAG